MNLLRRNRSFALVWVAGLCAIAAQWAIYTAAPLAILADTRSVGLAGFLWAVVAIPPLVIGPIAGVYVDRWDRRTVMMVSSLLLGGVVLLLALPIGENAASLFVVVTGIALVTLFYSPAENALLPTIVADDDLLAANSLNALNDNLGRILGPVVGAAVYASFGLDRVALGCGALFLIAAVLVQLSREREDNAAMVVPDIDSHHERIPPSNVWADLVAGARGVFDSSMLRRVFAFFTVLVLADAPVTAMLAPFVERNLEGSESTYGLLLSLRGGAGLIGGFVVAQVASSIMRWESWRVIGIGTLVVGIGTISVSELRSIPAIALVFVLLGPFIVGTQASITTLLQTSTDDAILGRVFGLLGTTAAAATIAGTTVGSWLGAVGDPAMAILLSGVLYAVCGVAALAVSGRATVEHDRQSRPPGASRA